MPSRAELNVRARNVGITPANYPNDSKLEQRVIYEGKQSATETGALAVGTLTSTGVAPTNGDTVTIGIPGEGEKVYTFRTALTEVKAAGTLTSTGVAPTDGDTVRIGSVEYTFKTTLSTTIANQVLIGASADAALDNLKSAINGTAGSGTTYSLGTVAHPDVTATTNTNTTQVVEARNWGTEWNDEPTLENAVTLSWGAATLTGGVAPVENSVLIGASADAALDNLKSAINGTAGAGTVYSTGTDAHTEVTATTNTNTTQVVEAISFNSGESIATTESAVTLSWGSGNLASGTPKVLAKVAADNAQISGGARV